MHLRFCNAIVVYHAAFPTSGRFYRVRDAYNPLRVLQYTHEHCNGPCLFVIEGSYVARSSTKGVWQKLADVDRENAFVVGFEKDITQSRYEAYVSSVLVNRDDKAIVTSKQRMAFCTIYGGSHWASKMRYYAASSRVDSQRSNPPRIRACY